MNYEIMALSPLKNVRTIDDPKLLRNFILTVGVVSNHGNWFTAEDHNKELKVLAQSYDWLLFLTDAGITEFVENLLIDPPIEYRSIKKAFVASYAPQKKKNQFTKVQMHVEADQALLDYFKNNLTAIEKWFNVIAPSKGNLLRLKAEIRALQVKKWREILR